MGILCTDDGRDKTEYSNVSDIYLRVNNMLICHIECKTKQTIFDVIKVIRHKTKNVVDVFCEV